jgi:proline iminopeptidase
MRLGALVLSIAAMSCGGASAASPAAPGVSPLLAEGDHRVDVNGHAVAYHVHGRGPVCVAHPGGPGFDWSYLRMAEAEGFVTLVYLEPVGSGSSARLPSPDDYTMARYSDELEGFRQAIGIDKMCLIGHSHGGFVAQRYALAHQDHLSALVLYDTSPRLDREFGAAIGAHAKEFFAERPWFRDAMAAFGAEQTAKTDDEMTAVLGRELPMYFADFDAHADAYRSRFAGVRVAAAPILGNDPQPFDTRAQLPTLHVPTLVIVGRRDFVTSVPFAEELHAGIAGSELVTLEHSGHMGHIEEPTEFASAVGRFVSAHAR